MADKSSFDILIIEDNEGDFELVEEFLLEQIEAPVITHARSFKEAQSILAVKQSYFDVILLDISLPDKTGVDLIRSMVEIGNCVPVIVLTGYADFNFGVKSLSLGIADYLLKDGLTPQMLLKSIIDSLERKKAAIEREESEKRYSHLFNLSPQPMWVYTADTLQFEDVNESAIKHYGYSREEFLSMTLGDITLPGEPDSAENLVPKDDGTNDIAPGINTHKKKNGAIIHVEVHQNTIIYKGKNALIMFANDITERLNYITAVEEQNKKLRDIAWIQSHVVRGPLARMMGLIDLFNNHKITPEEERKILKYILICANELDDVVRDISEKVYT